MAGDAGGVAGAAATLGAGGGVVALPFVAGGALVETELSGFTASGAAGAGVASFEMLGSAGAAAMLGNGVGAGGRLGIPGNDEVGPLSAELKLGSGCGLLGVEKTGGEEALAF